MSIFLQGPSFPLDEKNSNGWGVPSAEAANAIAGLKTSVIRVCSRAGPHSCDYSEDPYSEIGRIVDAWQEGNTIFSKGEITDQDAIKKILDGTWENNWSVFAEEMDNDNGWTIGFHPLSMTLVRFPAWKQAQWSITASAASAIRRGYSDVSQFEIISTPEATNAGGKMVKKKPEAASTPEQDPPEDSNLEAAGPGNGTEGLDSLPYDVQIEKLNELVAEKDAAISILVSQLGALKEDLNEMKNGIFDLTASKEDLIKEIEERDTLIASMEKDKAVSVPLEEVKKIVASESLEIANQAITDYKEGLRRETALSRLAAARQDLELKTEIEDYKNLTASEIEKAADEFESIKPLAASGRERSPNQYPEARAGANIGVYDPFKGGFTA